MRHQPRKLALLISLIGAGVSPYASARADEWVAGLAQPPVAIELQVPAATALDRTRWAPGLAWRIEEGGVDLFLPLQTSHIAAQVASSARSEAPHKTRAEARSVPSKPKPGARAQLKRVRNLIQALASKPVSSDVRVSVIALTQPTSAHASQIMESLAAIVLEDVSVLGGAAAESRVAEQASNPIYETIVVDDVLAMASKLARPSPRSEARVVDAVPESSKVLRSLENLLSEEKRAIHSITPTPTPTPAEAEQLMGSLAAVTRDDDAASNDAATDSKVAETTHASSPAAVTVDTAPAAATAVWTAPPRTDQHRIVVAPQSTKVLRSLETILSDIKSPFGLSATEAEETFVATQSGKVLATLFEVSSHRAEVETPADRKARKRAKAVRVLAPLDIDLTQLRPLERIKTMTATAVAVELPPTASVESAPPVLATAGSSAPEWGNKPQRRSPLGGEVLAMSESSLDGVRGGFVADGLNVSFGIERAVYVNGILVTTTSLNVSDLGRVTGGRANTAIDTASLGLIQSGAGNSVVPGVVSSSAIGTVVQNTLDGQKIQNVTVVNATVNSLGLLKGINLQSSLRGAVIDSLRR